MSTQEYVLKLDDSLKDELLIQLIDEAILCGELMFNDGDVLLNTISEEDVLAGL